MAGTFCKEEIFNAVMNGKSTWRLDSDSERGYANFLEIYRLLGELESEGRLKVVAQRLGKNNGRPVLTSVDIQLIWPVKR